MTKCVILVLLIWMVCVGEVVMGKIFKCCPRGFELVTVLLVDDDFRRSFDCMPLYNESMVEKMDSTFHGFEMDNSLPGHFPHCPPNGELKIYELKSHLVMEVPTTSCVDLVNNVFHVLMCSKAIDTRSYVEVYTVNKCCPKEMIFNTTSRECVSIKTFENTFTSDANLDFKEESLDFLLISLLLKYQALDSNHFPEPLFYIGGPDCSNTEVQVEYQLKTNEITISKNQILIHSNSENSQKFNSRTHDKFCIEATEKNWDGRLDNITWQVRMCRPRTICDEIPCIRKCCKTDYMVAKENGTNVCLPHPVGLRPTFHEPNDEELAASIPKEPSEYGLLFGMCEFYILDDEREPHYLNWQTGTLHLDNLIVESHEYCLDYVLIGGEVQQHTFLCFQDQPGLTTRHFFVYAVGLCISCVFLIATLVVYACLPKLLNLHGKTLVSHVISLLIAYGGLAYIQFKIDFQPKFCHAVGLFTYFSFLAAFSWLNVMCFDIWWTFGTVRQSRGMRKTRDARRFGIYSAYAWGIPFLLTIFNFCVDTLELFSEDYRPGIGQRSCWFSQSNGVAHRLFFLLPMGILVSANVVFFILTAIHCNKVKSEIHRLQSSDMEDTKRRRFFADKARLVMNVKLFCVMGVSWLLELIATVAKEPIELWYISDAFNVLQGVCVFLIFVFKRNVLLAIKKRLGIATKGASATTAVTGTMTTVMTPSANQILVDPFSTKNMNKLGKSSSCNSFQSKKSP